MILDPFRCAARDLTDPDQKAGRCGCASTATPTTNTWHPVKFIRDRGFREDTSLPFVEGITVTFHDETPEVMLNDSDQVEFAVLRPTEPPQP